MRKFRIYLGGSRGKWREKFRKEISDLECYDPFLQSKQLNLASFTKEDLEVIKNSDIVFFCINYPIYTGACVEAGYAHALGKEIILVFLLKGYTDPLLLGISRKVFTDFDIALKWFKNYIKRKMEKPFDLKEYLVEAGK